MKNIIITTLLFFLWSCVQDHKKEAIKTKNLAELKLSDTLIINEDFSISYLKIGSLTYADFSKKDRSKFTKNESGGLACGDSAPLWSSSITLKNDEFGLELDFSTSWEEGGVEDKNFQKKKEEEILYEITLNKTKAKFYNGITIGKSNKAYTKLKFGEPKEEKDNFLFYTFKENRLFLFYNDLGILEYVSIM